jgi:sigma-B regulation protein RsbU (phosphoserine phosphatase)
VTCTGLAHPATLAAIDGIAALWATLFLAACTLVIVLRLKLNRENARVRDLEARVDFAARRRRTAMELFHTLGSAFETSVSLENLLRSTVAFFMRIAQATGGIIYMVDRDEGRLRPAAMCGTLGGLLGRSRVAIHRDSTDLPLGEGILGEVALSGRPVIINDCRSDTRLSFLGGDMLPLENAMAVPLRFRDHTLGVLIVVNRLSEAGQAGKPFGRFEFQLLEAMAVYAATAIHLTLSYLEQAEKQRLDFDLGVASEIQRLLQPQHSPVLQGASVVGRSHPAYRVGGDHFDFIGLGKDRLGVVIADVSGKGVTGALVMAICHAIVRSRAQHHAEPADAIRNFRGLLLEDIPEDRFITMLYGVLNTARREFTFARAGHDPLLHYHAASKTVEVLSPKGGAIGLDRSERFDRRLHQQTLLLKPGDTLVMFTDGLTEATNPQGDEYGLDRLCSLVAQKGFLTASDLTDAIYNQVAEFASGEPAMDDQTLIVIKTQ